MLRRLGVAAVRAARLGTPAGAPGSGSAVLAVATAPRRHLKCPPGYTLPEEGATVQAWRFKVARLVPPALDAADEGESDPAGAGEPAEGQSEPEEGVDFEFARDGIVELPSTLFAMPPRIDLLHRVVVWQRREWWQGTSNAKTRGEVRGGGKKPWRQKGTGRARHGSSRSPIWRGGGVVHGPRPRDHRIKVPAKVQRLALRVALSVKYGQGDLYVVDGLDVPSVKTKALQLALVDQGWDSKTLIVGTGPCDNFALASRALKTVDYIDAADLNVYQMLLRHRLVLTEGAVDALGKRLLAGATRLPATPVNNPAFDHAYVKPKHVPPVDQRQRARPAFLPKQGAKRPPKRVVRVYTSPRRGGRRYVDTKLVALRKISAREGAL